MKYLKVLLLAGAAGIGLFSCKGEGKTETTLDTPTAGKSNIYVDNTLQPVIEDVLAVFHSVYDRAHLTQVNRTETGVINALLKDSTTVVVMPRLLTDEENAYFKRRKITPEVTQFATDAIALIANKATQDSVVELAEVLKVIKGQPSDKVKKLVFDNANSSTIQHLMKEAGATAVPTQNVYSLRTNEEVIRYVHENPGCIGIIGVNWLSQPSQKMAHTVSDITVMAVDNVKIDKGEKKYYKPTQSNIATGSYPLSRKVYVLNYTGRDGLGMGFATYIGAFEGQRIILKSGLLPVEIPTRQVNVRGEL